MFNKIFISLLLFIVIQGCSFKDSPEKAVNDIINSYNNGNISDIWERVLPDDRYAVYSNMATNINNTDLFILMAYALDKDNISPDNLSSEEYLYGIFKITLGDKDMELMNLEKVDDKTYNANIKLGEKYIVMPLNYIDNKWYMKIK